MVAFQTFFISEGTSLDSTKEQICDFKLFQVTTLCFQWVHSFVCLPLSGNMDMTEDCSLKEDNWEACTVSIKLLICWNIKILLSILRNTTHIQR